MRTIPCILMGLLASSAVQAASWYVDGAAAGRGDGTSWDNAWTGLSAIDWASVQPGDTVFISGGTTERVYAGTLLVETSGTPAARITVSRSSEAGHSGRVTLFSVQILGAQVTLDGLDWGALLINASHTGYTIRVTGDDFVLKNAKLVGDFSGAWGTTLYATAPFLTIERCWFDGNAHEDMIKYDPPGSGKLTIAGSVFMNNRGPNDGTHRDVVQTSGGYGFDVEVHHSLFWNTADVFLHQSAGRRFGNFLFYYNVFAQTSDVLKLSNYAGADSARMYNNVYIHNRDLLGYSGGATPELVNNIYVGPSNFGGAVHIWGTARSSLFAPGTETFPSGNGNIEADPHFVDMQDVLGPDGLPFTGDDGLNLGAGSPAIDAGVDVGYTTDITGRGIDGDPDMGAYEFVGGRPEPPENLRVSQ